MIIWIENFEEKNKKCDTNKYPHFLHSALKLMNLKTSIPKIILKALNEQEQSINYE